MKETGEVSRTPQRPRQRSTQGRALAWCFGLAVVAVLCIVWHAGRRGSQPFPQFSPYNPTAARGVMPWSVERVKPRDDIAAKIVQASHAQAGTSYDGSYVRISYPGGDVDPSVGVCTDVVVRALRGAGYDLQKLMHEDMKKNFRLYPKKWGLPKPDPNIDHRRVPNQMKFFSRFGQTLTKEVHSSTLASWQPGDIVCWDMENGQYHTGIISDGISPSGTPLVIHNGWMCGEDDSLLRWKIIGHFRYPKRASR